MQSSKDLTPEEYNEPVYYCQSCHSLDIRIDEGMADADWDGSYCGKCYSTHIVCGKFGEWLEEEERRAAKKREIEWSK